MSDFFPVQPHGPLVPIIEDAWFLTGTINMAPLVRIARNMVVLRHEGELSVISAVRPDAQGKAALDALGVVRHVIKIGTHGVDDPWFLDSYDARHWTVPDLQAAAELPIPGLSLFVFEHTKAPEAALLWDREGGLLITCDSVQHWVDHELMSGPARLVSGLMGFKHPAQIGPPWRKMMTPRGGSLQPDFERLVALPFTRLIGGHGGLLDREAQATLRASIQRNYPG